MSITYICRPRPLVRGIDGYDPSVAAESRMQIDPVDVGRRCGLELGQRHEPLCRYMVHEQILIALDGIGVGDDPVAAGAGNVADMAVVGGFKKPALCLAGPIIRIEIVAPAIQDVTVVPPLVVTWPIVEIANVRAGPPSWRRLCRDLLSGSLRNAMNREPEGFHPSRKI